MNNIFLVSYRVKGIKNFEEEVSLYFYKKTITKPIDIGNYNVKGIYGMNGSGKSAIIISVDILRNLLINENYLNNPIVQGSLDEIINKKIEELHIGTKFLFKVSEDRAYLYEYEVVLKKNDFGKYVIDGEQLSYRNAFSKKDEFIPVFKVKKGEIEYINTEEDIDSENEFREKTKNLLSSSSASSLFFMKFNYKKMKKVNNNKIINLASISVGTRVLLLYSFNIHVYMDQSDDHTDYFVKDVLGKYNESTKGILEIDAYFKNTSQIIDIDKLNIFSCKTDTIPVDKYEAYKDFVKKLKKFIQIFKPELKDIEIERKDKGDNYVCSLNMVYEGFSINSEFESMGIKKLIKLYAYLQEMVQGGIVFIDELDSNLHDVGPMDILKRNKKSIDFLSIDNKIYSWKTNGNYSPAKLYRNGMIEGSPFNIDAIDFIDVFDTPEG